MIPHANLFGYFLFELDPLKLKSPKNTAKTNTTIATNGSMANLQQ